MNNRGISKTETVTSGRLALRPKSYVVSVLYKVGWPSAERIDYHYHSLVQAAAHMSWICKQIAGQNGKNGVRHNVILETGLSECLRSKQLDKRLKPIKMFVEPKGRELPFGGVLYIPTM